MLRIGLLLLEVRRIPVRPIWVRVPDFLLVLAVRLRSAPQRARQIARGIKCQGHDSPFCPGIAAITVAPGLALPDCPRTDQVIGV